jgi:hypothetical protein
MPKCKDDCLAGPAESSRALPFAANYFSRRQKRVYGISVSQGLAWEVVFARRDDNGPKVYARRILIAGRRCMIRRVIGAHPSSLSACWLYFSGRAKTRWAEFVILPFRENAFVIPRKLYRQTVFVFGREKQSPGRPHTIDWRSFYGAWGQLRSSQTQKR